VVEGIGCAPGFETEPGAFFVPANREGARPRAPENPEVYRSPRRARTRALPLPQLVGAAALGNQGDIVIELGLRRGIGQVDCALFFRGEIRRLA